MVDLQRKLEVFNQQRNWEQYHHPKNLVMAMSVEVAELMEWFQWETTDTRFLEKPLGDQQAIADEVADVFLYLLQFCRVTNIDPVGAALSKLEKNALKYPVSK